VTLSDKISIGALAVSVLAMLVSFGSTWLAFFYRRPKASIYVRSSGSTIFTGGTPGDHPVEEVWQIEVSNIGTVPIILTQLSVMEDADISVQGRHVGVGRVDSNLRDIPMTSISVEDVKTFEVAVKGPSEIDDDYDPPQSRTISIALLSARGMAQIELPARVSREPTVVSNFR
jgi:hypothetical protein